MLKIARAPASGPAFRDLAGCVAWLERLPLTHAPDAQEAIRLEVARVARGEFPPFEALRILEALHDPLEYVQSELARQYTGKPVPLSIIEHAAWTAVLDLWRSVHAAYAGLREAIAAGDRETVPYAPLIGIRCLGATSQLMAEHHRVYRELDGGLWRQLHADHGFAERQGCAGTPVQPAFGRAAPSAIAGATCTAAYVHALLAALGDPNALVPRSMELLFRWLDAWAGLVTVTERRPEDGSGPVLAVDAAGDAGARPTAQVAPGPSVRYLNLEALAKTVRRVLAALRQGETPSRLGLGRNVRQPGCERLLTLLYIQWCGAGTGRINAREGVAERAMVCQGIASAHFHLSGKPFRQPGGRLTAQEEREFETLGRVSERTARRDLDPRAAAIETWQIVNRSAAGFLGFVRNPEFSSRITHGELLAIRRAVNAEFQLGVVQWLRQELGGEFFIGVRLLPGAPVPSAVRIAGGLPNEKYVPALALPEARELQMPATLVMEPGLFQPGRFLDLHRERGGVVRLERMVEAGADFERAAYSVPA